MKLTAILVAFALVVPLTGTAGAAEPESAPATAPATPVVPLMKDEVAPFDGLLVPEATFVTFLRQKIALEECGMRVAARDKALAALPAAPAPAPAIGGKFGAGLAIGVVGGVVIGVAVVWAATQVLAAGN